MTPLRLFRTKEDGAAAVEFAILAPLLLLMAFGIMYFGLLFGISHSLQLAAAEATRASVRGVTTAERLEFATAALNDAVANSPLLENTRISVDYNQTSTPFVGLIVTVTYNLEGTLASNLPFLGTSIGNTIVREAYIAY